MSWKRPNVKDRMKVFLSGLPDVDFVVTLDIGTGDGIFSLLVRENNPSSYVMSSDLRRFGYKIDNFLLHSADAPPFRKNSLDLITLGQVLHYIPHVKQQQCLNALIRCISAGGFLIVIEYNTSTRYGWLPYPLSAQQIKQINFDETVHTKLIHDNDRSRPKYAFYISKKNQ